MTDEQIRDLRRRIDAGEDVSNDEIMAGLDAIRTARLNAATTSTKKEAVKVNIGKIDLKELLARRNITPQN